jgi:sulfur relay protein TusB/DsrH
MLHIISKPFNQLMSAISDGDSIVLLQDSVYCALLGSTTALELTALAPNITLYVLEADVIARGLQNKIISCQAIQYLDLVTLTEQEHPIMSW